jgi:serine/threonine-protein kinase
VAVPDLTDLTLSEAQAALDAAPGSLHIGSQTQAPSATIKIGHIISQTPNANQQVGPKSFIDVVISTGPQMVTVPDVVSGCLSVADAQKLITDAGLVPVLSGTAPVNPGCPNTQRIAAQSPAAGMIVQAGTNVSIAQGSAVSPSPSTSPSASP